MTGKHCIILVSFFVAHEMREQFLTDGVLRWMKYDSSSNPGSRVLRHRWRSKGKVFISQQTRTHAWKVWIHTLTASSPCCPLLKGFAGQGREASGREAGRHCTMHLRVGKQHPAFSLATNLCCSDVGEVGCYNRAAHRDADAGNGGTVHSPDVDVAKFQRVCIGDVFVENYVTLHCILSNWR